MIWVLPPDVYYQHIFILFTISFIKFMFAISCEYYLFVISFANIPNKCKGVRGQPQNFVYSFYSQGTTVKTSLYVFYHIINFDI